jgi:hypothetical protein
MWQSKAGTALVAQQTAFFRNESSCMLWGAA